MQNLAGRARNEAGFALPLTLFLVAILTVILGAAFVRASTERMIAGSSRASGDALFIAQSGLQLYLGRDFSLVPRPVPGDSFQVVFPRGYAWVVPQAIVTPADTMNDFRYLLRSTGYVVEPSQGTDPLASRTIAQFADWRTPWLSAPPAALLAANGVNVVAPSQPGTTVLLQGNDLGTCTGGTVPNVAGLLVPADTAGQTVTYRDIAAADVQPFWGAEGSAFSQADTAGIAWGSVISGAFQADYDTIAPFGSDYPSQLIVGDYSDVSSAVSGKGLLIVTGDLTVGSDGWYWEGIVLVGGALTVTAPNAFFFGAVITGLNHTLAPTPPPGRTILGGPAAQQQFFYFYSCAIERALSSERGFAPIDNTLIDNWATF